MSLIKRTTLLVSMALLALAFAIPASASAYTWTYNGVELEEGETASQSFEGTFAWWIEPLGKYSCEVAVELEAESPSRGAVVKFNQNTSSCSGSGYWGGCQLVEYPSNLAGAQFSVESLPGKVGYPSEKVEIVDIFKGCTPPWRIMKFPYLAWKPTLDEEGRITAFTLEGTDQSGFPAVIGPLSPAGSPELGLQ